MSIVQGIDFDMKKNMVENQTASTPPEVNSRTSTSPNADAITLTKLEEEILSLLRGQTLYGLQIVQAYEEVSGGKRTISIGTLYPTLSRLESNGFITSYMEDRPKSDKGGARRKYFRITALGSRLLNQSEDFRKGLENWRPAPA